VTHRTAGADNEPWLKKALPAIAAAHGLHEALAIEKRALFDPSTTRFCCSRGEFFCARTIDALVAGLSTPAVSNALRDIKG
jgi:hypothetical protein